MSKMNAKSNVWAPPEFPLSGRLPLTSKDVLDNYRKQRKEEDDYLYAYNEKTGRRNGFICSQSLHISFFFDGTGNNEDNDTNHASPTHPTNIAKMFHATYSSEAEGDGYYAYYMPGVGTAFPEIGEMDYSDAGLQYATGGENRINWALLMLADALLSTATKKAKRIRALEARQKLSGMASPWPIDGVYNRINAMNGYLNADTQAKIEKLQKKVLKIKLFIYGFSRGAAEARTFVNWLTQLFRTPKGGDNPEQSLLGIPLSIEFLGLLDTVPSVGVAHIMPMSDGHMAWANGTQQLPDEKRYPGLIKCCRHFIAAHEQRLCFPLDSVRRPEGSYPSNTVEVVYPGMHSDIGGGYPPGDQGKGLVGQNGDPNYPGNVLSQVILHDLYATAFSAGAPLTALKETIPDSLLQKTPFRIMSAASQQEFDIEALLINRFNAWRQTIIPAGKDADPTGTQSNYGYSAHLLSQSLEDVVSDQIGLITAWRIGRYTNGSYANQPFYLHSPQHSAEQQATSKQAHDKKQQEIDYKRRAAKLNPRLPGAVALMNQPGVPAYEPTIDRQEIREAAEEFRSDYLKEARPQSWGEFVLNEIPKGVVWMYNTDDEAEEFKQIKGDGEAVYPRLFTSRQGEVVSDPVMSQVVALFDDQIHDSRAWFMYSSLGTREPWGSYFFYRSIYFGSDSNKDMYLLSAAGQLIGAPVPSPDASYRIKNPALYSTGERKILDNATGKAIPLADNATELLKPTRSPGLLADQANTQIISAQHQAMMSSSIDMLKAAGAKVV